jgi:hypothetical protein
VPHKAGFPVANFLARSDLFPLSVSLITSARRGKMDVENGKLSLRAKIFASGKSALVSLRFSDVSRNLGLKCR